jgi:H+-transporting ATPase
LEDGGIVDLPRPAPSGYIRDAREYGIIVKMITGDHLLIAKNTARQLEMGDRIFTAERLPLLDTETKESPRISVSSTDICASLLLACRMSS